MRCTDAINDIKYRIIQLRELEQTILDEYGFINKHEFSNISYRYIDNPERFTYAEKKYIREMNKELDEVLYKI